MKKKVDKHVLSLPVKDHWEFNENKRDLSLI